MSRRLRVTALVGLGLAAGAAAWLRLARPPVVSVPGGPRAEGVRPLAGSASCRKCHEAFFEKWSTSFHGLAMRPYGSEYARAHLRPMEQGLEIQGRSYRAVVGTEADHVEERGPDGIRSYPIVQVLGGKNVAYFLTPLDRGFLQTLPLAFDVQRGEWISTTASAVRHFEEVSHEELPWTDRAYTFNTACFGCHVSQISTNYDPATDSYRTVWAEPGINCETCHGPAGEHVEAFERHRAGDPIPELKLVSTKQLSPEQRNDLCSTCHAKASPLWSDFRPGDRFFDHFDLVGLESPDYYPDGRDRGENYTFTSWRMSPCVKAGGFDCVDCHTSSGRYKWRDDPNGACRSCHPDQARDVATHSRHRADGPAGQCVACHLPRTEFARMRRSDHSMRPPSPAASLAFGSPNACNLCHQDRDAAWADRALRRWRAGAPSPREERLLREGRLVAAARAGDWSALPALLAYLAEPDRDEIVTASLVRLLETCPDPARWPALRSLAADRSPLVRAAAVAALALDAASRDRLVEAASDATRLVRIRAAAALNGRDLSALSEQRRRPVVRATEELIQSLSARPDQFASHYSLGNLALERGEAEQAAAHFRKAVELRPDHVASLVNLSLALARSGQSAQAEAPLRQAIAVEPRSGPAHFNLGLLLAEQGRDDEARTQLRAVSDLEPANAAAAYNLAVLEAKTDPRRAAALAARAARAAPSEPRYAWTEGFYLAQAGDLAGAQRVLEALVRRQPDYADGWLLLGETLERRGRAAEAAAVYRRAAGTPSLSPSQRAGFAARADALVRRSQRTAREPARER